MKKIVPVLVGGVLASGTYLTLSSADPSAVEALQVRVAQLGEREALLHRELLRLHSGLSDEYDSVGRRLLAARRDADAVEEMLVTTGAGLPQDLEAAFSRYRMQFVEKEALVSAFIAENSTYHDSLRRVPALASVVTAQLARLGVGRELRDDLNELVRSVLAYGVAPGSSLSAAISRALYTTRRTPSGLSGRLVHRLEAIHSHAEAVISQKPRVDGLVERILAIPTHENLDLVQGYLASAHRDGLFVSVSVKRLLYVVCAGLGFYLLLTQTRLRHTAVLLEHSMRVARRERQQSDNVLRSIPDALFLTDGDGCIVRLNQAAEEILEDGKAWIGRSLDELFEDSPEATRTIGEVLLERVRRRGEFHDLEAPLRVSATRTLPVSVTAARIRSGRDGPHEIVIVARDIRVRKLLDEQNRRIAAERAAAMAARERAEELLEAKEAAEEANRSKGNFLANMSHEIRTPMNGVLGIAQLLATTSLTDEQQEYVSTIESSAEALLLVIGDVLDYAKIESGRVALEPEAFDLAALIEDVAALFVLEARERPLELVVRIDPALPTLVVADPGRIRQILLNLVGNAFKFTDQGGVYLALSVERVSAAHVELAIAVHDTGIGIAPDMRASIFDRFTQADASSTRRHGGTGLGLAISSELTQLMGGSIDVASEVGHGSTFTLSLTLPRGDAGPRDRPLEGRHVALLGGEESLLTVYGEHLERAGASCSYAHSLEELEAPGSGLERSDCVVWVESAFPDPAAVPGRMRAHRSADLPTVALSTGTEALRTHVRAEEPLELVVGMPVLPSALVRAVQRGIGSPRRSEPLASSAPLGCGEARPERVLLVEDNAVNRRVAERMLLRLGCEPTVAVDGAEAVARCQEESFDLVLMDCQMPRMDGYEATAAIRATEANRGTPVVAMTAHAGDAERERCEHVGMVDLLPKPMRLADLAAVLDRWSRIVPGASERSSD